MRTPLSYIPLLPLLLGIVAGILFQRFLPGFWLPCAMAVGGCALLLIGKRWLSLTLFAVIVGWIAGSVGDRESFENLPAKDTVICGAVAECSLRDYGQVVCVDADSIISPSNAEPCGNVRIEVTLPFFTPSVRVGDIVEFGGTFGYPKIDVDLPLQDDRSAFYYNRGIALRCYSSADKFRIVGSDDNLLNRLRRQRDAVVDRLHSSGLAEPAAEFLSALLVGFDDDIDAAQRERYASAGVAHLLALSGMHVAMLAAIIALLLIPLSLVGLRRVRWGVTIIALWAFAVMTGMSPSVVRAVIMASAVMLALMFDRPRSSLNSLCFAAILILVFSPRSLFMPGFQLSFLATASIILFAERLTPTSVATPELRFFISAVIVSVAAALGTMPLVAYYFHKIPLYFIPTNLVALFVTPLMMSGGILLLGLSALGLGHHWLSSALDAIYAGFDAFVDMISSFGSHQIGGLYFTPWLLLPLYCALAMVFLCCVKRRWQYGAMAAMLLLFSVCAYWMLKPDYGSEELYFGRDKQHTYIFARKGNLLEVITNDSPSDKESLTEIFADRYKDFIASREIGEIDFIFMGQNPQPTVVRCAERSIALVADKNAEMTGYDYALITKGFSGDVVNFAKKSGCRAILLSSDINKRRRERYFRELTESDITAVDLYSQRFSLKSG